MAPTVIPCSLHDYFPGWCGEGDGSYRIWGLEGVLLMVYSLKGWEGVKTIYPYL